MVWGDAAAVVMVSPNKNDPTKVEPLKGDFRGSRVTNQRPQAVLFGVVSDAGGPGLTLI
jgi:hypothetical protein